MALITVKYKIIWGKSNENKTIDFPSYHDKTQLYHNRIKVIFITNNLNHLIKKSFNQIKVKRCCPFGEV